MTISANAEVDKLTAFCKKEQVVPPPSSISPISVTTNSVCLNGSQPIVTFQASGSTDSFDFSYSINGGELVTIHSSSNKVTLTVPTTTAGTYEYKLVSYSDSVGAITTVNQSISVVVSSVPVPDTTMNGTGKFVYNGATVFKICGNSSAEFEFVNASTTTDTNTSYTIDWGDGTVETISSWTSKKHIYAVGYYNLVYSITNSAGCSATQTYKVFLGSNPAVGFTAALNADICAGSTLIFPLTGTNNNPPGTTYEVSFSDGSIENYTQETLPATISHTFDKNSCGYTYVSGSSSIPNSFSGTVKAINPCGVAVVSVGPIFVSSPPKAEITVTKNNCLNTIVCIQNTSKGSVEVSSGTASCDSSPAIVWTITPNTGFTVPAGSTLGKDYGSNTIGLWDKGSATICPTFTVAGTYTIKMRVGNRCGVSETTTTINIDAPLVPKFSLDSNTGCTPLIITTSNTTVNTNISEAPTYQWDVAYTEVNCGSSTPIWDYVSSTNQNSLQPKFNFTSSGIYKIKLFAINSCGAVGTTQQEVQVFKKSEVSINPIASVCQNKLGEPVLLSPTAIVNSCTSTGTPVTYAWSFPGGTPALSTDVNPKVSYMPGTYTISLSVTNQCGIKQATDVTFTVAALPNLVITNPSPICAPTTVDLYDEKIKNGSDANLEYSYWADDKATIPLDKPYQIAISGTYYIKATHKANGCSLIQPVTVVVNPITAIIGDLEMCLGGSTVQLQTNPVHALVAPWTSSDPTVATISNSGLINSVAVGHTDITYTDEKGCAFTKTFYVNTLVSIKKNPEPTQTICVGGEIPPLVVDYNGGAGTPKYEWYSNTVSSNSGGTLMPGATTLQFTPPVFNTPGKYYYYAVISLSSSGCGTAATDPAEVIVLDNIKVTSQPMATQTLCKDTTPTALHVVVSGGATGGYSYQWYKNTIHSDVGGRILPFEIYDTYTPPTTSTGVVYYYCVITQINNGCKVNSQPAKVEIVVPPTITLNPVSGGVCLGTVAQPLTVSYTDGAGVPSYQWYSTTSTLPLVGSPISGANDASFIPQSGSLGTFYYYCVISFTGSGCTAITSEVAKIIVSTYPIISPITVFTCSGVPFEIAPQDGTGNVVPPGTTYTWDYPVVSVTNAIQGAEARRTEQSTIQQNVINSSTTSVDVIYSVTPNSGGCIGTNFIVTAQVNPDIVINPITTPIKCSGANDASIVLNISGGTAPYETSWSNLAGGVSQNNLSAGDYTVIVTDAKGCARTRTISLPEPPVFRMDVTVKEISCHGANNGSINLNIIGGEAPLKLIWSDNALAGKDRNNLAPGGYSVAISDGTGCIVNKTFVLLDPQELVLTANTINAFDCTDANSGAINLLVSGGTAPFAYQWSNGVATKDLTALSAGNYGVKVSDSRGCVKETSYSINRQEPLVIKVDTNTIFNCDAKWVKQKFIAHITGGVAPYQLHWLSGEVSGVNNEIMTASQNGIVLLEVIDGLGCEANYSINVKIPVIGNTGFNKSSLGQSTYGLYAVKDPIQFKNIATGDFESIAWDFGDGTSSTDLNPLHTYLKEGIYEIRQVVKYAFGCSYTNSLSLKVEKGYEVIIPNAFTPNNNGFNDTFRPVFKGITKIKLKIFNTWGGTVFEEIGSSLRGWDGKWNGNNVPNGNYFYKITATTFYEDEVEYNGPFVLIK
ncbi:PKD domain-containing protein [Flavobacterium sp.]|uniref:PKD domain-containing protein n=1 Tax=Flavobacterium sp. TaxID=239 RepID=UPI00286EF7D1|nr:PKD domain-containing protein [Flavobacterium sp.]